MGTAISGLNPIQNIQQKEASYLTTGIMGIQKRLIGLNKKKPGKKIVFNVAKSTVEDASLNKQILTYIVLFFLLLIALLVFTSQPEAVPPGFETVSVDEAREMIEKGDIFVLDVRTPAEFNESHIEGAVLIPLESSYGSDLGPDQLLEARIDEIPGAEKILVYCRTGRRSAAASQMLVDAGYTDVYNMEGGINEWIEAGYPVVTGP